MNKLFFNAYYWVVLVCFTAFGLSILPIILLVNVAFLSRTVGEGLRRSIRFYGWVLVCLVPFLSPVRVEYRGGSLQSNTIFVANHNSAIDPYLFGAIPHHNSFVTSWPFKIPVYGFFMRIAGYINASDGWDVVREKCEILFSSGSSLTIWPEGHRSRDGKIARFKNGAFRLSVETGCPIVPVCILGSAAVLPPGKKMLTPGKVRLIVLDPIYPEENGNMEERVRELRLKVRLVLEKTLESEGHFKDVRIALGGCN